MACRLLCKQQHRQEDTQLTINFDKVLGVHPAMLELRARRSELLASNLANADTPNYKARDMDFKAIMAHVRPEGSSVTMTQTQPTHFTGLNVNGPGDGESLYRTPNQAALDGNTVEPDVEQAEFARNALQYQATLSFLGSRIKTMFSAIRGD